MAYGIVLLTLWHGLLISLRVNSMRIVAYKTSTRNGKVLLEESTGEFVLGNEIDKLFSFLVEPYNQCIKVCWDLDATVSVFLRLLGVAACRKLRGTKRHHQSPFNLFYIPEKVFSVSHVSGARANLYGLEQYFPDLGEPDVKEVQLLGMKLLDELKKMGLRPTKLTSPVAVYEECVLSKMNLPKAKDMPVEASEMAWRASGKLWIESHIIAYFP